jgi:hypothetical protein
MTKSRGVGMRFIKQVWVLLAVASAVVGAVPAGASVIQPSGPADNGPIFFDVYDAVARSEDIYRVNPDGTGLTNLTKDFPGAVDPYVTPDGTRVYFTLPFDPFNPFQDESSTLYSMRPDGTEKLPVPNSRGASHPSVAGGHLVYQRCSLGGGINCRPWRAELDGSAARPLTPVGVAGTSPNLSPDGTRVAYIKRTSGPYDYPQVRVGIVRTLDPAPGAPAETQVTGPSDLGWYSDLSWSRDGLGLVGVVYLAFGVTPPSTPRLAFMASDGSAWQALPWAGQGLRDITISPDGQRFVGAGPARVDDAGNEVGEVRVTGVGGSADQIVFTRFMTATTRLSWSVPTPPLPPLPAAGDGAVESVVPGKDGASLVVTVRTRRAGRVVVQGSAGGPAVTASLSNAAPRLQLRARGKVFAGPATTRMKTVRIVLKAAAPDRERLRALLARGVSIDVLATFLTRKGGERVRHRTVHVRAKR